MHNKTLLLTTFFLFTIIACKSDHSKNDSLENTVHDHPTDTVVDTEPIITNADTITESKSYWAEAVKNENEDGWGYIIYQGKKPYIKQPHIPAISGVKPFKNEEDAIKTGNFAISKIENGIMPPTITKEELDSLGVLY